MASWPPSWPDTCHEVAALLDELAHRLSSPFREPLNRMQELGRARAVHNIQIARDVLTAAADATWSAADEARFQNTKELLEEGEFRDQET